ncbi:ESPR-type extended signal peptide-containing protein [Halomonas sp. GT]|uniref:ESPR-type extended signal peptide-containing protein n=1 Tax=Halomonas sp. GT TaxID=1971364 RepID=UPI0009F2D7EF|nr:ESPR-type extended signal peptide-containing protein [Halomonas sp. GT]
MNNVFRLIWKRALGRLVVASEAANSKQKAGAGRNKIGQVPTLQRTSSLNITILFTTIVALGITVFTPQNANAYTAAGANNCANGNNTRIAIGQDAEACENNNIAIGAQSISNDLSITLLNRGNPFYAPDLDGNILFNNIGSASVALGENASALGGGVAIGGNANTERVGVAIGAYASAGVNSLALGPASKAANQTSLAFGRQSFAGADYAQAIGNVSAAIGESSLAIGHSATAEGLKAIAIGGAGGGTNYNNAEKTHALGERSIAIGDKAQAMGSVALALGSNSQATSNSSLALGERAEATELQSIAVGLDSKASGGDSLAIGTGAIASGDKTISIGFANEVSGTSSGAIGDPNIITGAGSYALGNDNTIDADEAGAFGNRNILAATADGSRIIGNDNNINVSDAMVVGNNADVTQAGGVALGSGSVADTAAGIAGYVPFGATAADTAAINGTVATQSAVDIGSRQITSVAAGTELDDAVNVSQLVAAQSKVEAGTNIADVVVSENADGGTIYTVNADGASVSAGTGVDVVAAGPDGDNVTDYEVALSQDTQDSLLLADSALQTVVTQIDGTEVKTLDENDNVANFVTGDNIVLTDDAGGIKIATADDVTFTSINSDSLAITGGPTLTGGGIDMNATTISNLADGVDANDAVNVSQLESSAAASRTEVTGGTNIASVDQTTGADGQAIYTVNADGASVTAGAGVDVVAAGPDGDNVTDYEVALNQDTQDSLLLADSALQTVVTQIDGTEVKTLDENDNVANFVTGDNIVLSDDAGGIKIATADDVTFTSINSDSLAITGGPTLTGGGIDMNATTISNLADGVNANDAVNLSQLEGAAAASKTEVEAGTNVASVDQTTGADGQAIYTVNAEGASVSAGSGAVDVTAAAPDADNVTDYAVDLSQASKDSLELADSALQTVVTQIDGTEVKTLDENDNVANFVTGDNIVLTDDAGGIKIATADDVTFTSINSDSLAITGGPTLTGGGIDMNATTISNLADGVNANDAVNFSQLEGAAAASRTEVEAGTNVASVDQTTGADGQAIYTVNADGASVSAGSGAVDVTAAAPDANNVTDYAVDLSQASKDSLELADSAVQTVVTQIDGTEVKTLDENDNVANFVTGDNIVLTDDAGGIKIATAEDVIFTSINSDSLAINGGPTLTGGGIDMNNTTISNLADGVNANDAVNLSQLEGAAAASRTEVEAGTNVASVDQTTGADGQAIYTVNADGASVSAGTGVDVVAAGPDGDNVTDYEVALSQDTQDSLLLADSALQTVVTQIDGTEVKTLDENDNVANFVTGDNIVLTDDAGGIKIATANDVTFTSINSDSLAITGGPTLTGGGIDMNNTTISNLADGVDANDAVNLSQLEGAAAASKTEVEAGTNVASVDQATGADGQAIYTVNADGASVSAGTGVDVVAAGPDGDNVTDYEVALSQDTQDSLLLADSALQTVVTQIDGTEVKTLDENDNVANFVTGDNIVLSDDAGGIKIATADDVTFTSINSDSLAITGGPTLTGGGIDMNNTTISNLADGVNANDAVNLSQLEGAAAASRTEVEAGTNVASVDQTTGADGQAIYTVNAEGASVSAGSGAVDVTAAAPDADNVTDYAVDLSQASKDSLELADSALQTVVTQIDGTEVKTLDENDNVANFVTGDNIVLTDDAGGIKIATADDVTFTSINSDSLAITGGPTLTGGGIDMNATTISNLADGVNANDAVNFSQLEGAAAASRTEVEAGTNVASVDQTTGADGQAIYTVNADGASVSAGSGAVDVTAAAPDANNVTDYAVDLSQASKDSLELADSAVQTVVTQIDGTEVKTLDENDNVANFVTGDNIVLTDDAGGIKIATAEDVIFTSINSDSLAINGGPTLTGGGIDMNNTTISNLADGVNANDAVNVSQLESSAAASRTEVTGGTNIASVDQTTGADGQAIYTVNADGASVSAGTGVDVVAAGPDGDNVTDYEVALSQDTQDSLLLADSALQTVVTQIDGTEVKTLDENDNVANFVTGDNIVLTDDAGGIKIATANDVTFTSINSDSLAITGGPTLTGGGIDMNNTTISNLADGVDANDAVNLSQLEGAAAASKTEVEAGTNVASVDQATGADGQAIYTVNADGASVSAGTGVDVVAAGPDGDNVTDYEVALSQDTQDSLLLADSALQTVVTQIDGTEVKTLDENDNVANFVTGDNIVLTDDAGGIKIATADDVTFTSINSDSLAITGGPTLNSDGIDMGGDTITNVGAPVNGGDALNLDYFNENRTRYYSVNDAGTAQSNYENDGASGINALAAGTNALAEGNFATAVGDRNTASADNTTAIGSSNSASADNATSVGTGNTAEGTNSVALGVNNTTNSDYQVAIGGNNTLGAGTPEDSFTAIAIGRENKLQAQNTTVIGQRNEVSGRFSSAFGYQNNISNENSTAFGIGNQVEGRTSVAMGFENKVTGGGFSRAIGYRNEVSGQVSTAIGHQNTVSGDLSSVIGAANNIDQDNAFVLGNFANVSEEGGVAIGTASNANTGAGISGYNPLTGVSDDNDLDIAATKSTYGAVAVGDEGNGLYRQITGVAAGTTDSDAVNVAQLKAVNAQATTPLTFAGDNAGAPNDVDRKLGETLNIIGGATDLTDNNIGVVANGDDTLEIKLAKNLTGLEEVAITGGPTLTGGGIDMNATTISNLADGVDANDAVNLSQLEGAAAASKTEVAGGTNIASVDQTPGADGQAIYTVNADGASVSAGSGAMDVTAAAPDADNVTDYAVDLSQASKDSLELADSALQTVVTQIDGTEVKTLDENDNVANFVTGDNIVLSDDAGGIKIATADDVTFTSINSDSLAITGGPTLTGGGIDMNATTISNLADGVDANDAVNVSQLESSAAASRTEVTGGTNIASVDQTTGADGQAIYTVNADGASVSAGTGVDVVAAGPDTNNVTDFEVALNQDTQDSLLLADSAVQTVVTQIDGTEVKTLDENDNVANFVTGDNIVLTDDAGGIKIATAEDVIFTSINSDSLAINGGPTLTGGGIDMNNTTISNLADGVNANDAVNLSQLEGAAAASRTEVEAGTNVASVDQTTGADGQAIYTVNADGASVSAGTGVDVVAAGPDGDNVTDYEVALSQDTQDSLLLADSALQTVVTQIDGTEVKTLDENDNVANFVTGDNIVLTDDAGGIKIATANDVTFTSINSDSLAITGGPTLTGGGIDMNNTTISNLADGVDANDAVNLSQLEGAAAASKTEVEAGTNVASVDQATGADGQAIYTVNADGASVSAGTGVDVVAAGPDGDNVTDYEVALSQDTQDSLLLADSALQTVVTQIDGTEVKTLDENDNVANFVTGDNIVLTDDAGGIKIATADDVTFTSINSDSLAITGGPTLTGGGIDMNNTTISNLADGVNANDAVNLSQLEGAAAASKTEVEAGTNVASVDQTTGADGQAVYTVNADGASVSAGSGALDVTAAAPDADNVTDYTVDLSQASKDSLELADSALQTVVTQIDGAEVKTLDENDNVANFVTGDNIVLSDDAGGIKIATANDVTFTSINSDSLAITGGPTLTGGGIDMNATTISNLADGVDANDAVNLSQLEGAAAASRTEVEAGTNVASVDQTTGADGQAVYTVNADGASVSAGSGAVDVTAAAPDANNVTDYAVDLSQASKDSLELADSALQTVVTQIDGTEVKTLDQDDNVANFVTGDNIVLSDEAGGIKIATADDVTFTSINSDSLAITGGPTLTGGGIDMNNTTISNLADGVDANDAVNLSQLEGAAAASKTEVEAGTNVASVDQTTGADGQAVYTVNADGASVSAGSGAVDVTAAAPDADNVTDYAVDLSQASKDSLELADSALQTVVTQIDGTEVKTLDQDDNVANFVTGDNIVLTDDAGGIKIATANDVTFTSINSDSLAITGGPTLTGGGIDMNATTISNLADGVDANDAVNLSQLEKVSSSANAGWNVTTSNETGTASSNVGPNASVDFVSGDDNVVISHTRSEDGSTSIDYRLADDVRIGNSVSVGDTSISNDGLVITGGPSVTTQGIDAGNKQITNAASGVGDTPLDELEGDALGNVINAGDLQNVANNLGSSVAAAKTEVEAGNNIMVTDRIGDDGQVIYTVATADEVSFDQVDIGSVSINADNMDESGNTIISGVGEGGIGEDSTDAINGSQLWATQDLIKNLEGGVINIAGDLSDEYIINNGRGIRYARTNDEGLDVSDAFAEAQGSTALGYEARATGDRSLAMGYEAMASHQGSVALGEGARTSAQVGTTSIDIGDQSYTFAGANPVATVSVGNVGGERTITNLAAGRVTANSTDAINGSQLYAAVDFMNDVDSRLTIVEGDLGGLSETVAGIEPGTGEGAVEYARNDDGSIDTGAVELAGEDGTKVTNVAPGEIAPDSSDAVTGGQLHDTNQSVAGNSSSIEDNRAGINNNTTNIEGNRDSIADLGSTVDKGLNVIADQGGSVNRKLGDTVAVTGDENITTRTTGEGVQVTLNRELKVDSVTTGNTTVNNEGVRIQDGPSMTQAGFNANGTTITNVAPGVNVDDAVNVGQMNELGQRFANEINNVHGRIDKVERNANAGIAAVAAMGHAPYVPGKLTYHVGGGHHGGESAVGVNFRRTADNGRWSLNAGIAGSRAGATIGVGISGVID